MRSFQYYAPAGLAEAVKILAETQGRVLAGGTDLLRDLKARRKDAPALVDVSRLPELRGIALHQGRLSVGGAVRFSELERSPLVNEHARVLARAAAVVGSPQIRNRGTIGGNLANASPAADTVPALVALEATVRTVSVSGVRELPVQDVLCGVGQNTLLPGEIITEISFDVCPAAVSGFAKLGRRRALAIARLSLAAVLHLDGDRVRKARLSLGAVAPNPFRALEAERALCGEPITRETIEAATAALSAEVARRLGDRPSAPYKRVAVVGVGRSLLQKLLLKTEEV
ncbi:MAG: xanthine dehydrogenase family protein subunit M [Bacillota bacterium]